MELLVAIGIGVMVAAGVYLLLRERTFSVVLGLCLLSYAVNFFLFATGRLKQGLPPIVRAAAPGYTDPLAQALVLTAIVIGFAMTAFIVVLAIVSHQRLGEDRSDPGDSDP
jgi:multicomponent K+:H+ antiporter subunit C